MPTQVLNAAGSNVFVAGTDWSLIFTLHNDGALTTDTLTSGTFQMTLATADGAVVLVRDTADSIDNSAKTLQFDVEDTVTVDFPAGKLLGDVRGALANGTIRNWGPFEITVRRPFTEAA